MPRNDTNPMRRILVETNTGQYILENVPANAKVTFSKVNPASERSFDNSYCLRVYTSESNQLAVMTGVISFRDLSIGLKARKVTFEGEERVVTGPDGRNRYVTEGTEYEWVQVEP